MKKKKKETARSFGVSPPFAIPFVSFISTYHNFATAYNNMVISQKKRGFLRK